MQPFETSKENLARMFRIALQQQPSPQPLTQQNQTIQQAMTKFKEAIVFHQAHWYLSMDMADDQKVTTGSHVGPILDFIQM